MYLLLNEFVYFYIQHRNMIYNTKTLLKIKILIKRKKKNLIFKHFKTNDICFFLFLFVVFNDNIFFSDKDKLVTIILKTLHINDE